MHNKQSKALWLSEEQQQQQQELVVIPNMRQLATHIVNTYRKIVYKHVCICICRSILYIDTYMRTHTKCYQVKGHIGHWTLNMHFNCTSWYECVCECVRLYVCVEAEGNPGVLHIIISRSLTLIDYYNNNNNKTRRCPEIIDENLRPPPLTGHKVKGFQIRILVANCGVSKDRWLFKASYTLCVCVCGCVCVGACNWKTKSTANVQIGNSLIY